MKITRERLEEIQDSFSNGDGLDPEFYAELLNHAEATLDEWFNVKERLPDGKFNFATFNDKTGAMSANKAWTHREFASSCRNDDHPFGASHFIELPEPPKPV